MNSCVSNNDFWKKKTVVSYWLSVLVFLIHISSFAQYDLTQSPKTYFISVLVSSLGQFAVPLFFILSGSLFFRNYTSDVFFNKISKRFKTLVLPYLLWNFVGMVFAIVATIFFSNYFVGREMFEFSVESFIKGIFFYGQNGPFWFIADLIIFVLLSPIINYLLKFWKLSLFVLVLLYSYDVLPNFIFANSSACLFYFIGAILGSQKFSLLQQEWSFLIKVVACVIFVACIGVFCVNKMTTVFYSLNYGAFLWGNLIFQIVKLFAAFSFWIMFDFFKSCVNFEKKYYNYSFWVYALHINISAVIAKLFYLCFSKNPLYSYLNFVVTLFVTLFIINMLASFVQSKLPRLYSLLSGGR